jgi:hypothetical protein
MGCVFGYARLSFSRCLALQNGRVEVAGYGGAWNVRFKADVGGVERQGAPLMHPEAAGGWVRGAREGAGWVDQDGGGAGARR